MFREYMGVSNNLGVVLLATYASAYRNISRISPSVKSMVKPAFLRKLRTAWITRCTKPLCNPRSAMTATISLARRSLDRPG